ncbi:MAG: hypothetical protein BGO78_07565 [Chloroflexi bacterium 44-23]|nr:MAG: hypothetical protein BGO78_07565 [Chloroflexi bacterium 44-23]
MEFLENIRLIQGGMGVYVSNWHLASTVAKQRPGVCVGTVSGTGLDWVYVRLMQLGDPGGHIQRAFSAFDSQFGTEIGQEIFSRYYIPGGKESSARFKNAPKQVVRAMDGTANIPLSQNSDESIALSISSDVVELVIISAFAEVWLAKQGHSGRIFINFLKKVELPLIYGMYGAMLAGVDGVVVGAGNPDGLAAIRSKLVNHQPVSIPLPVLYREAGENFHIAFNPDTVASGNLTKKPLKSPAFLAIASLQNLVKGLAESTSLKPDGFIIEHHTAGGHNASPQGPLMLDQEKQPIYGEIDDPDIEAIRRIGIPFWLAGGYGNKDKLQEAISLGATGVQVGSIFAMSEESGMDPAYRIAFMKQLRNESDDSKLVKTTLVSPTGFPFKVLQLEGTTADDTIYEQRLRVCDIGLLQQLGLSKPDANGMRRLFQRCSAAPIEGYIHKRGLIHNTQDRRCLCNGLLSAVGLGQVVSNGGSPAREPAILTLGNHIDGIRRLSRNGQARYWVSDVVDDILGNE